MAVITSGVLAAGSLYMGYKSGQDAKKNAANAASASQIDINRLDERTRALAKQNAIESAALEKQLTPEVAALRTGANQQLLSGLGKTDPSLERAKSMIGQNLGVPLNTPLLNAAIAKAQADLGLGGQLSRETQNLATRQALATAGTVGGGLGLGRDLVARDLGLTSLQLEQQRLQNASQLGGQELQLGEANASNFLNNFNLLRSATDNDFARQLALAQYAQGIQQPIVGLDPASAANIEIANATNRGSALSNLANTQGAQSQGFYNAAGGFAGNALMQYNNRPLYTPTYASVAQRNPYGAAGPAQMGGPARY
jgi:hypothetical protein